MILNKEQGEAFNLWAFGIPEFYFYRNSSNLMAMELWNHRHSDLMKLEPDSDMIDDLTKMIELWEKHGKEPLNKEKHE